MSKTFKRRNYLIKKEFQGKYIFSYFMYVVAGSIIFMLILSIYSANTLSMVYEGSSLHLGQTPVVLFRKIFNAHWVFIVLGGILVVLGATRLTHRIAGPLFRYERSLEDMINGRFGFTITLRPNDESKEVADHLNRLNEVIALKVTELRSITAEIQQNVTDNKNPDAQGAQLEKIKELTTSLSHKLDWFNLE